MYENENHFFDQGYGLIAGIDEVGRGAWAGPVGVGVVIARREDMAKFPVGIKDSKLLSPSSRKTLSPQIMQASYAYGVGFADNEECDELGMTNAQGLAAERAIAQAMVSPDHILLDGKFNFTKFTNVTTMIKGDSKSLLIAAASIIAKVARDDLMVAFEQEFPGYGLAQHKGYPSVSHRKAVSENGLSLIHRRSWRITYGI